MTNDGMINLVARLGATANNALSQGTYRPGAMTLLEPKLRAMYTGSWIVRKLVDCIAEDMTRAGIVLQGVDEIDELHAEMARLRIWPKLTEGIQWGRLYGGAISVMMIDGQDLSTPLNLDTVTRGSFMGLQVFDRWRLSVEGINLLKDGGDSVGHPTFYTYDAENQKIHYTRVLRHEGDSVPFQQRQALGGWGASVVECMNDRIIAFDSVTLGVANLVFKAHLRTLKIKDFRAVLAQGGKFEENLIKSLRLMQSLQTNEGLTVMDVEDEFNTHSYSFGGLSEVILQFGQQLSGASGIPLVRLFGQSPAGLNRTGDGDIRNYYDSVNSQQESRLRTPIDRLLQVLYRSKVGKPPPVEMAFQFTPLWQLSASEKATIAKTHSETVGAMEAADIITKETALRELKRQSLETGVFTTITDEEINAAADEPPLPLVEVDPAVPGALDRMRAYFRS
jgi:phage-related protein (TIGR01555 family)